jgi:hypothetical protein
MLLAWLSPGTGSGAIGASPPAGIPSKLPMLFSSPGTALPVMEATSVALLVNGAISLAN